VQRNLSHEHGNDPDPTNAKADKMTYQNPSEQFAARIPARGLVNSTSPFLTARKALSILGGLFTAFGNGMIKASEASSRMGRIEKLNAKSDEELAEMGIRRDKIAQHVMKDLFYC